MGTPLERLTRQELELIRAGLQAAPTEIGQGAQLSGYALNAISTVAGQTVFVFGILRQRRDAGDVETTLDPFPAPVTVSTTSVPLAKNNPDRVQVVVVNNGSLAVFLNFDQPALSTSGVQVAPNGGVVIIRGNDISVYGPATARAAPADRNATVIDKDVETNVGAAARGVTQDWTYTVPAGRKADVTHASARAYNNSGAALADRARSQVIHTVSGGGSSDTLCQALLPATSAGNYSNDNLPRAITMLAGDSLSGSSFVASATAGAAVFVEEAAQILEYDA